MSKNKYPAQKKAEIVTDDQIIEAINTSSILIEAATPTTDHNKYSPRIIVNLVKWNTEWRCYSAKTFEGQARLYSKGSNYLEAVENCYRNLKHWNAEPLCDGGFMSYVVSIQYINDPVFRFATTKS